MRGILALCVLTMCLSSTTAHAGPIFTAIDIESGSTSTTLETYYAGWAFRVGDYRIRVTDLGFFDENEDGLNNAHTVYLWTSAGDLVYWAGILFGDSGPGDVYADSRTLIDSFRYASTDKVFLQPGQEYIIGALINTERYPFNSPSPGPGDKMIDQATISVGPGITYLGNRIASSSYAYLSECGLEKCYPDSTASSNGAAFLGPNMRYSVPEPPLVLLFAAAILVQSFARRRFSEGWPY